MKLLIVPALLLALSPEAPVRFESDGVRVGPELVTGAAISLKSAGALPLLVSGSVVESLSSDGLTVSVEGRQVTLGAGLRLARAAEGYRISTHGAAMSLAGASKSLAAESNASFMLTEKGFDFGALGLLEGNVLNARMTAALTQEVKPETHPQDGATISPEHPTQQRLRQTRRVYSNGDPQAVISPSSRWFLRQVLQVTPEGAPN